MIFIAGLAPAAFGQETKLKGDQPSYPEPVTTSVSPNSGTESLETAASPPSPLQQPEDKGVLNRAVKRNFSTRHGVELTEKDKQAVAMNPEDAQRYAAFLEGKDTGFARLYDTADCEMNGRIVNVGDQCPVNMRGRGTSYSFRRKKYQSGWFSDLKIQNNAFQVTGLNVLGMLTDLGDAPLGKPGSQGNGWFSAARKI